MANIQKLLTLIKNNVETKNEFDLSSWISPCKTVGCLVGNDLIVRNPHLLKKVMNSHSYDIITEEYDISFHIAGYLFCNLQAEKNKYGFHYNGLYYYRDCFDKEAALNRVRKYVYMKMRQKELCYDEKYGVKPSIRNAEGNHNIMQYVKQQVEYAC